ncbi:glycosyl transferase, family 2 [Chitinispirillum alkaliphilum]|nr:glycosyl transferase, family 2 [Chitinispirillum alkaliphilum]
MTNITWPEDIYILIPSYKSVSLLREFLKSLIATVPLKRVCVVDDGSHDGTKQLCEQRGIECIVHKENMGKGAALNSGFKHLIEKKDARWIVTMDADGQHSPDDLGLFLEVAGKKPETGICIGARTMKPGIMPLARICSNKLTSGFLSLITSQKIPDSQSGYRLYSTEMLKNIVLRFKRFEMETEVILKARHSGFPINYVQVQTLYLKEGSSHISHFFDTVRWMKAVLYILLNKNRVIKPESES